MLFRNVFVMKFFVDSADLDKIKQVADLGLADGVTTNPSLASKQNKPFKQILDEICAIVDGPISAEVTAVDFNGMMEQGRKLSKFHKNIVVKLPCTEAGLKATKALKKEKIPVNMTLVFSTNQALLAAKAGAAFVSPFVGRLDDIGEDGMKVVEEILQVYKNFNFDTQVLVASVRNTEHVLKSALLGAHVCTCPPEIILELVKHHKTDEGLKKFLDDWAKKGEKI